jgi:hypothetical protein
MQNVRSSCPTLTTESRDRDAVERIPRELWHPNEGFGPSDVLSAFGYRTAAFSTRIESPNSCVR